MKYFWKVWKWEDGHKSQDLTAHLTVPVFTEPHLDETLGSGEIILDEVISALKSFPPKTKFRIEKYLTEDFSDSPEVFDYIVDSDQVEDYVGCPEISCHRIQLIDPAAICQGWHVDNIALTRELNDNDLNYKTTIHTTEVVNVSKNEISGGGYARPDVNYEGRSYYVTGTPNGTQYFTSSFRYVWSNLTSMNSLLRNLNGLQANMISFTVPTLTCMFLRGTVPETLFECPTRTTVTRTTLINNKAVSGSEVVVAEHFFNPVGIQNRNDWEMYNSDGRAGLIYVSNYSGECIWAGGGGSSVVKYNIVDWDSHRTRFPAMINTNDTSHSSREFSFQTTPLSQTEIDNKKSYLYTINCVIAPYESGAAVQSFSKKIVYEDNTGGFLFIEWGSYDLSISTESSSKPQNSQISLITTFYSKDMLSDAQPNPFLVKPKKYSCFDLIRKALLTIDTQIIDNTKIGLDPIYDENFNDIGIQYPIIIDPVWMTRLKSTQLFETTFETKNFWEICLQVGYYLHAIPKLVFANDGSDKFMLTFRQLGDNKIKANNSTKITIFNSQNLSEYFTQLDSYVTNIFSPQNHVEEWLVCKTSDSSYLVSNDTAELQTKYNISEVEEFDIQYNGVTLSALNYIFEKTVYNTLTAKTGIIPGKWAAIYYEMGTNKISGLNYVPPTTNNDGLMALKKICGDLFGVPVGEGMLAEDFQFNDLKFHIKYKTQDTLRISQFKPNLYNFMKNSKHEKYPHHEQYYGQEDKIVDSERFSANLWGRLVRIANGIYQCNEYAEIGEEKEVGDLVEIKNELYYVMSIENEFYNDVILQKVTYSKNFNQISQVVTIPSEPRFYEISERSVIRREVRMVDFLLLTTKKNTENKKPNFMNTSWKQFIKSVLFTDGGQPVLPNFAFTRFKADVIRAHLKENNEFINPNSLYPNSETELIEGVVSPKPSNYYKDVIVPLLHFPLRNAIVFEWDMDDNFKAGDAIDTSVSGTNGTVDQAYYSLLPVRYCDVMGKADLFSFRLFNKEDWTMEQAQRLPFAEAGDFIPTEEESIFLLPDRLSIGLDKDNREAISFNYQINLLNSNDDDRDLFVIFSNVFGEKKNRLKMLLLNHTVSMFDETVELSTSSIVADNIDYVLDDSPDGAIEVKITRPDGIDMSQVKSIILYDTDNNLNYAYIAKNVGNIPDEDKLQSWWIYPVFTNEPDLWCYNRIGCKNVSPVTVIKMVIQ